MNAVHQNAKVRPQRLEAAHEFQYARTRHRKIEQEDVGGNLLATLADDLKITIRGDKLAEEPLADNWVIVGDDETDQEATPFSLVSTARIMPPSASIFSIMAHATSAMFEGIPLDVVSVSMTMRGAVLPVLAAYIFAAEE